MKAKRKTNTLTFSAMMIAVFIVIHFVFPANNRGIQSILGIVTPVPIAIYCHFSNYKNSLLVSAVSLLMTLLFFEPIMVVSFILPNIILGVILGLFSKKNLSWGKLTTLTILNIGFNLYEMYINYLITGINFITLNIQAINTTVNIAKEYFKNINGNIIYDLNLVLLPLMLIVGGTLKTLITCFISKIIIERMSGTSVEHKGLSYAHSNSVILEIILLIIYIITLSIWGLFLAELIKYRFFYSVLLDIMLLASLLYYSIIHRKLTEKFKSKKVKHLLISILFMSLFFIISPIAAISKIIKHRRLT